MHFFIEKNYIYSMENTLKIDADEIFCDDPAVLAAMESFGIKYLFPWQRLVIANIMDAASGENQEVLGNQIVLLPTGAGKSMCFQVPAMLLSGPTLVIYPLLALMTDQQRRMEEGGIKCVVFRGGQSAEERENSFRMIEEGAKIIIANPEVLSSPALLERLKACGIQHVAIDEAHCVSEWGDSFRPAYLELGRILKELAVPVVTAFTATASPEVLSRVAEVLFEGSAHIVRSESDRPNIHYYVRSAPAKKTAALILAATEQRPMIIFCGSRSGAEDMARELNAAYGEKTSRFYHAGLSRSEKTSIEQWFFKRKDVVLCATCAYGMGVDKKDIHTVVHLDPPETAEAYIQEAGRGGRDGSIANAILLWNHADTEKFSQFPRDSRKAAMLRFSETEECRRQVLLDALGAEQAVCSGCDLCDSRMLTATEKPHRSLFPRSKYFNAVKFLFAVSPCRTFSGTSLPASRLPDAGQIALSFISLGNRYFTEETLEPVLVEFLNGISRSITGLNLWGHSSYVQIIQELKAKKLVYKNKWPWKDRLSVCM